MTRTAIWLGLAALALSGAGLGAQQRQPSEFSIPLDAAWQRESAGAAPKREGFRPACKDFTIGTRGTVGLGPEASNGVLVELALDPVRNVAEIHRYLEDIRDLPLANGARGVPWGLDFTGASLTFEVNVPGSLRDGFAQAFLESENADGIRAKYYGPAVQIGRPGRIRVAFSPEVKPPNRCDVYVDTFFDLRRVVGVGLKIGLDRFDARDTFTGRVTLTAASIRWRPRTNNVTTQAVRQDPPRVSDREVLSKLVPVQPMANTVRVSSADLRSQGATAGGSITPGNTTALNRFNANEFQVRFAGYQPSTAARSARATVTLPQPLDLVGRTVSTSVAVGPALRGVLTRPNQAQLELYDIDGKVFRGAAESLSGSITFSPAGVEHAATWVTLNATPFEGNLPAAMGHKAEGFRADAVSRIGIRFEIGKHSDALLGPGYAAAGTLLVSDFWIRSDTVQAPAPVAGGSPPAASAVSAERRTPMPLVGINYAFIGFGTDLGIFPYGDRDISLGFSAYRHKLARDFQVFCAKGIDVVRVFLLGDLRTGLRYDAAGYVAGLDVASLIDLNALLETAGQYGVKLIPVLLDFTAVDGANSSTLLDRTVPVGEAPLLLTSAGHRRAFVDRALRSIVRALAEANRRWPGMIYAVDIANEIENAKAVFVPQSVPVVVDFVRTVRDMIRAEAPRLDVTVGSRDRDALVNVWRDADLDVWQYHYYDKMEEEEARPLSYPASRLGLSGPVILGEVEPSNMVAKLDTIAANGYDAALFWSWRGLDGYVVNIDELARWKQAKRVSLGLPPEPDRCRHP